jgi:hypothetical protein
MEEAISVAETTPGINEWYGLDYKLTGLKVLSKKMNQAGIGVILQVSTLFYHTVWLENQALTLKKNTVLEFFNNLWGLGTE